MAIIVVLGILTAFIAPRFTGTGAFAEYTVRDQIIAAARYAQQQAMSDRSANHCYRFHLDSNRFGPQRSTDGGSSFSYFGPADWASGIPIENGVSVSPAADIVFNGLGNAVASCASGAATASANLSVAGEVSLNVCVETTGYAHSC